MSDSINVWPLVAGGAAGALSAGALWSYAVFAQRCQYFAPVIRSVPQRDTVALTFDDGPDPAYTPRILDILGERGIKATFFVIGRHARAHPELVRRISAEGHDIGNHSYDHAPFRLYGCAYWVAQLKQTQQVVADLTGKLPVLFRPPRGYKTRGLAQAATMQHLPIVGWSVRLAVGGPLKGLLKRTTGCDIVVLHDGVPPGMSLSRQYTVEMLPDYLAGIAGKGLRVVGLVDTLLSGASRPSVR